MMLLRIICIISISLVFGPVSQSFDLNINVTQSFPLNNKPQVYVTWDVPTGFYGNCTITITDLYHDQNPDFPKIFEINKNEYYFQTTLGCSHYLIELRCSNLSHGYYDSTHLAGGLPPSQFQGRTYPYELAVRLFFRNGTLFESIDIVQFLIKRTKFCHYMLMGSQCSTPNEVVTQLLKGCTHSCDIYKNNSLKSVFMHAIVPYSLSVFNFFEIRGDSINKFCSEDYIYELKSSYVTQMQVDSNRDLISVKWSPPLHPGGFISHYVIKLKYLLNNTCEYVIISCQENCSETYSRHNRIHSRFVRGIDSAYIEDNIKNYDICKTMSTIMSTFSMNDMYFEYTFHDPLPYANYNITIIPVNGYRYYKNLDDFLTLQVKTGGEFEIIQTSFKMNNAEILIKWNNMSGFNGEYKIEYQNSLSNDWNKYTSKSKEITFKDNLICGSKYNLKIAYADYNKTYFDESYFYVGQSPASITLSSKYNMVLGALVVEWIVSSEFDYIVHIQSNSSCQYILMGPQCSVPNQLLVNSFKGCRQHCREYNRSRTQRVFFVIDPNEKYHQTNLFLIEENLIQEFCDTTSIDDMT